MKTTNQRATLAVEDLQEMAKTLRTLRERTPLHPLTPVERQQYRNRRLGPRSLEQLQERLTAAREHPELLPPAFDLRAFTKDATLAGALGDCLAANSELRQALYDELLVAADKAKQAGDVVYGHLTLSAGTNATLQRKVSKLGRRVARAAREAESGAPAVGAADAAASAPAGAASVPAAGNRETSGSPAAAPPGPAQPEAKPDDAKAA